MFGKKKFEGECMGRYTGEGEFLTANASMKEAVS